MTSSGRINKENADPASDHKALSEGYGSTEAVLLPRDPNWMFIYWEIPDNAKAGVCKKYGQDIFQRAKQVIRVYDITGAATDPAGQKHFDVPVRVDAKSWYINVHESGRLYRCELGLVMPEGGFISLVRTNTVKLPAGGVTESADAEWISVTPDFDKLLQLSGVDYIGKGSGEVAKSLARRWEMLRAVFSRASSWGIGSMSSQAPQRKPSEKKFRLVADCELILYGATEPAAFVTVAGRKVNLNPDGTFSMRFAFPDGGVDLPVKAVSKDGTDSRETVIKADRTTTTYGG